MTCAYGHMPAPNLTLAELQVEAIRGVIEELLSNSGTGDPKTFSFHAIGEISRILDMEPIEVTNVLAQQEERRKWDEA